LKIKDNLRGTTIKRIVKDSNKFPINKNDDLIEDQTIKLFLFEFLNDFKNE